MGSLSSAELLIILAILLLVFGGAKLPKLARSLGQAKSEFSKGISEGEEAPEADSSNTESS